MIKIKMHRKIIFIVSGLVVVSTAAVFGIVAFTNSNSMGLNVPEKTEVAKHQSSVKKTETKKTVDDIKKIVEEENRGGELETEQVAEHEEEKPEELKQEEHREEEPKPDVITTEDVENEEPIAFGIATKNEANLKKGQIKVDREGVEGLRKIITRMTYKNNELISSEEISNEVVRAPVEQINLLGTSDFNLNNAYIQLYNSASVTRGGSEAPASMILVSGSYYIYFWFDPLTWDTYAPSKALLVSGGSFSYDGNDYGYNVGPLNSGYPLNETFCAKYGLACGRW